MMCGKMELLLLLLLLLLLPPLVEIVALVVATGSGTTVKGGQEKDREVTDTMYLWRG